VIVETGRLASGGDAKAPAPHGLALKGKGRALQAAHTGESGRADHSRLDETPPVGAPHGCYVHLGVNLPLVHIPCLLD
jgi:hypothetical protein